jgi:hypothetical protein
MLTITGVEPANGSKDNLQNTLIEFTILDDGSGIDINSLVVEVNGERALLGSDFLYEWSGDYSEINIEESSISIILDKVSDFKIDEIINVKVQVKNLEEKYLNFNFTFNDPERFTVHVWRSKNPVNGLEYGNGGVKLLPRKLTLDMDVNSADMTTSISTKFKIVDEVSNITAFNTDPFNSWKSAFRECCKLASRVIDRQNDNETQIRLDRWCTIGSDLDAIAGAIAGREYGTTHTGDIDALKKINDFVWLKEKFDAR